MDIIKLEAYAKINICLDVTGKRADGYHDVRMVMTSISLKDVVTVKKSDRMGLTCTDPEVPAGETNLAWRAALKVMEEFPEAGPVEIHIEKNIPMAAGLAGGSTDAAAVIKAMDKLYGLEMSGPEMDGVAVKIGADVPYCLRRGTYLAEGIGEKLTPVRDISGVYLVLANPDFQISTKEIYQALDSEEKVLHPDTDGLISRAEAGDIQGWSRLMGNVFEPVTERLCPKVKELRERLLGLGALGSRMTGTGPTVFAAFATEEAARAAIEILKADDTVRSFMCRFVGKEQ